MPPLGLLREHGRLSISSLLSQPLLALRALRASAGVAACCAAGLGLPARTSSQSSSSWAIGARSWAAWAAQGPELGSARSVCSGSWKASPTEVSASAAIILLPFKDAWNSLLRFFCPDACTV